MLYCVVDIQYMCCCINIVLIYCGDIYVRYNISVCCVVSRCIVWYVYVFVLCFVLCYSCYCVVLFVLCCVIVCVVIVAV